MAFPAVHMLVPAIIVDLFCKIIKRKPSKWVFLAAAFGGILPDADFAIQGITRSEGLRSVLFSHGGISHTFFFAFFFFIIALVFWKINPKHASVSAAVGFGVLTHIALDMIIGGGAWGGLLLLWPLSSRLFELPFHLPPDLVMMSMIDGIFLGVWLTWMVLKGKLRHVI